MHINLRIALHNAFHLTLLKPYILNIYRKRSSRCESCTESYITGKKTVLELGGSDPFKVCEDADIEKASAGAIKGQ
jgi:hypothetical protein